MKKIALFFSMMTMALWGNAQSWITQASGVTATLNDVFFINDSVGWVATDGGVLKTTNGGSSWNYNLIGTGTRFNAISFPSENIGWAVGTSSAGGLIYKTVDGGLSWTQQTPGTNNSILTVHFVNDSIGWFASDYASVSANDPVVLAYTTNGGTTWTNVDLSLIGTNTPIRSIYFLDANLGWFVGDGGLIGQTVDGGLNWNSPFTGDFSIMRNVNFQSPSTGWFVGNNGRIYTSSDSGTTWTQQNSGSTQILNDIAIAGPNEIYVCGNSNTVLKTNNGGTNWSAHASGISVTDVKSIFFRSATLGWCVGTSGKIYKYNSNPLSISNNEEFDVQIYPNPADNIANIEFENFGNYQIKVLDISGKLLHIEELTAQNHQINTESWPAGIYQINITNENGQMSNKTIVKQ
jgi:photosystem II stability/assembly factor-like uncharacterized protein